MELFSLLAKLTLDKSDFDKGISEAEKDAGSIELETPTLGLDADEFTDGVAQADTSGQLFGSSMEGVFKNIKNALTVTGIVGAITGIVSQLKEAINMTAATADGIDKGSKRLDISRKAYQEWDHALRQSGSGIADLSRGIRNFQTILTSAEPGAVLKDAQDAMDGIADEGAGISKDVAKAFSDLGLTSKIANREIQTTEELMEATLLALADYKGTSEERGVLTRALFGNNADGLNALLDEGKDGVQRLLTEASDLGLIMDDEEIDNAVAYGDAVANLQAELDAIKQAFVANIIPKLTEAVEWVTQFLATINPRNKQYGLREIFDDINSKALGSAKQIDQTATSATLLIEKLAGMGDYWTLNESDKKTWTALAQEFIDTYPQFAEYIDLENNKIKGNTEEIKENIKQWAIREKQQIVSSAMAQKQEAVAKKWNDAYEKQADAIGKATDAEAKAINSGMYQKLTDYFNTGAGQIYAKQIFQMGYNGEITQPFLDENWDTLSLMMDSSMLNDTDFVEWMSLFKESRDLAEESANMMEDAQNAEASMADQYQFLMDKINGTNSNVKETTESVNALGTALDGLPKSVEIPVSLVNDWADMFNSHATGSLYIPYDNYPALLHRGEVVQTATQTRQNNESSVDISAFESAILRAVQNGMENAQVNAYVSERDVATGTNRYNGSAIDSGRFRP